MTDQDIAGTAESAGFFRRNRIVRLATGLTVTALLLLAYAFGIASYRAGMQGSLPSVPPPAGGVAVVLVPDTVDAIERTVPARLLVFPSPELLDDAGNLAQELEVRVQPAVSSQTLLLPAGEPVSPIDLVLPTTGIVQEYPFDTYDLAATIQVHSLFADSYTPLPVTAAWFLRIPGWSSTDPGVVGPSSEATTIASTIQRDGSTKSIAILLLLLMVILAAIAVLVTSAATRGRMRLELSVASWMTALLFALLPIRGFFPGSPPLGSWMDVLVFFWVELILMIAVAAVVTTILMRARDARHHPQEQP